MKLDTLTELLLAVFLAMGILVETGILISFGLFWKKFGRGQG